jgi:hypothetical protein
LSYLQRRETLALDHRIVDSAGFLGKRQSPDTQDVCLPLSTSSHSFLWRSGIVEDLFRKTNAETSVAAGAFVDPIDDYCRCICSTTIGNRLDDTLTSSKVEIVNQTSFGAASNWRGIILAEAIEILRSGEYYPRPQPQWQDVAIEQSE